MKAASASLSCWIVLCLVGLGPAGVRAQTAKPLGEDGQLKLVDSADKKPQRWVRNLSAITPKSAE